MNFDFKDIFKRKYDSIYILKFLSEHSEDINPASSLNTRKILKEMAWDFSESINNSYLRKEALIPNAAITSPHYR